MKIYVVGGAVRDVLLGHEPKDIDYCITGSNPNEMIQLGYIAIPATSFPVFHDKEHNEYSLARTERKSGNGYHGFESFYDENVTIEEDLFRRDLSINSMAVELSNWESFKETNCNSLLIDPYNGLESIKSKILKHTSIHFKDDPLRVLRLLRFANRYDYDIHPDTILLIKDCIKSGELNNLTPERIYLEFEKVFQENKSISKFISYMDEFDITKIIFEYDSLYNEQIFLYDKDQKITRDFAFISTFSNKSDIIDKLPLSNHDKKLLQCFRYIQEFFNGIMLPSDYHNLFVQTTQYKDCKYLFNVLFYYSQILNYDKNEIAKIKKMYSIAKPICYNILSIQEKESLKGKQIQDRLNEIRKNLINDYMVSLYEY